MIDNPNAVERVTLCKHRMRPDDVMPALCRLPDGSPLAVWRDAEGKMYAYTFAGNEFVGQSVTPLIVSADSARAKLLSKVYEPSWGDRSF